MNPRKLLILWCPEGDLNPHDRLRSADFKSAVSADFTIRAFDRFVPVNFILLHDFVLNILTGCEELHRLYFATNRRYRH